MLEQRVRELKEIIAGNDGRNAADAPFARTVDELVAAVYDRIGDASPIASRTLFDLFVIKVLYVGRGSRHADIIEYLGSLLERCISAREAFPEDASGRARRLYFSDMLEPGNHPPDVPNVYEAYRRYADSALFLAGVFPAITDGRRRTSRGALRRRAARGIDRGYYVSTGKTMYRMSAADEHRGCEHGRGTLQRLSEGFELYVDALNEMSARYILGADSVAIADHMLDAYNRYRATGDAGELRDTDRYAALLDSRGQPPFRVED